MNLTGWYSPNYAYIEYSCGTAPTPKCIQVSYGQETSITCPANEVIVSMPFASWGTPPAGACGSYSYTNTATNGLAVVSANCMGRQSCVVPSNCGVFGCWYPGPAGMKCQEDAETINAASCPNILSKFSFQVGTVQTTLLSNMPAEQPLRQSVFKSVMMNTKRSLAKVVV